MCMRVRACCLVVLRTIQLHIEIVFLQLAQEYDLLILEDDPYYYLQFTQVWDELFYIMHR